jgi:Capsule assembly protein Wzi
MRVPRHLLHGVAALLLVAPLDLHAQPSVPWSPSAALRHDVQLLADEAGLDLTVSQWPLPRAAVRRAVERLREPLAPGLLDARDRVLDALRRDAPADVALTLGTTDETLSGFGDDATPGSSLTLRSPTLETRAVAARIGARAESHGGVEREGTLRLDDTALATEFAGVQLQTWAHRSWWGPGWQSSLILGGNAPALVGLGLQRASASRSNSRWLAWLGPWNVEMFVARTEGMSMPADPYLVGQRFTFKPVSNLEIGLTRTAQWGGEGRPQSWRSFAHMLSGIGVNADTVEQQAQDPANGMAGYDARLRCPTAWRCAGYLQLIGEDRGGFLPSRYLGLYGLESWSADGRQRVFAEYTETGCRTPIGRPALLGCAYRNYAYPEGYTNAGRWLGASAGPDSRLLTLGWLDVVRGTSLRVSGGRIGSRIGVFAPEVANAPTAGRFVAFAAQQTLQWRSVTIVPQLDWVRIDARGGARTEARIGVTFAMPLDALAVGGPVAGPVASVAGPLR